MSYKGIVWTRFFFEDCLLQLPSVLNEPLPHTRLTNSEGLENISCKFLPGEIFLPFFQVNHGFWGDSWCFQMCFPGVSRWIFTWVFPGVSGCLVFIWWFFLPVIFHIKVFWRQDGKKRALRIEIVESTCEFNLRRGVVWILRYTKLTLSSRESDLF